jgi:hypothetical protein
MKGRIRKFRTLEGQKNEEIKKSLSENIKRIRKANPDGYVMIWKRGRDLITIGHGGLSMLEMVGAFETMKRDVIEGVVK